ncbi:MAG: DNA primase regulatory subunit PriL [Candidatus Methanospirareceae archaeon]
MRIEAQGQGLRYICRYPFVAEASKYVEASGVTLGDLIGSAAFERARIRGKERVIEAIDKGEIEDMAIIDDKQAEMELFSYPFSRILVSCAKDEYLLRRYALSEAKLAYKRIIDDITSSNGNILQYMASEFDIDADFFESADGIKVEVSFVDYLRLASSLKEKKWKLVNRIMEGGRVKLRGEEFARLLQEAIHARIKQGLPSDAPVDICEAVNRYVEDIKKLLEEKKGAISGGDFGYDASSRIDFSSFPPCITHILNSLKEGLNVSHSARFAATAFLLNIGMKEEEIIDIYRASPDFDEEKTRYQVEHIAGSKGAGIRYTAPSCATMRTYGNCVGCEESDKISHPLSYYRRKLKAKKMRC